MYDDEGLPAYEGQAMVRLSCGSSAFCHAATAEGVGRFGAPAGLDFDMTPVDPGFGALEPQRERLDAGRQAILDHIDAAYLLVESGEMPPFGEQTLGLFDRVPRYTDDAGERIPPIDSVEGIARYRNWLACDAPVVEATSGSPTFGDVVPASGKRQGKRGKRGRFLQNGHVSSIG
mgnify:CR=1 FL=1